MNSDGTGVARLLDSLHNDSEAAWSPDGERIAFTRSQVHVETSGYGKDIRRVVGSDIYLMNADGSGLRRLTMTDGYERGPDWSPDGQRISFNGTREGYIRRVSYLSVTPHNVATLA